MTENAEESNSELPLLSRHDFQSLIKDTLLFENYPVEEKADTKAKEQLIQNLVMTCLIAQKIVRDGDIETKKIEKIQTAFKINILESIEAKRGELNKLPNLLKLPFLISKFELAPQQIGWTKIAFYLAIVLKHHKLKSYYQRIIKRLKIACFYKTPIKTWILENLPHFSDDPACALQIDSLRDFLVELEIQTNNKTRRNQATEIRLCLEVALNPKRRKKIDRAIKKLNAKRKPRKKKPPQNLSARDFIQPTFQSNPNLNTTDDVENYQPALQTVCFESKDTEQSTASSTEVTVDNTGEPLLEYQTIPNALVRYNAPLQMVDLSVRQMFISQRELMLNSSVYLLSPKAYQLVFARLVKDCQLQEEILSREQLKLKTLAAILLLSMITSIPVESLMIKGFVRQSGIFKLLKTKVYLHASFEITARKKKFEAHIFENEKAEIELPMPIKLVGFLANKRLLPTQTDVRDYIAQVRTELSLPYLSVHRIESVLQVSLTRYIEGSNSHIAEIICRIPPISAPAKFYSSHMLNELITHYKNALVWLRKDTSFDLGFLETKKDYTTGSGQALTLSFVKSLLDDIFHTAVITSASKFELFNNVSSYVWLIFCLTTGIRPNNRITHIHDIDLNEYSAQILISDKPNRSVRNHRLVPICPTLVTTLTLYRWFLAKFAQLLHRRKWVNQVIKPILYEHDDSDNMLINLICEQGEKIATVKRGQIAEFIKPFFDIDPYFTRHFVRVQLEKRGVEMPIINGVIGHEKHRQEFFGRYSSGSKSAIYALADVFEAIANDLGLNDIKAKFQKIDKLLHLLPEQSSKPDETLDEKSSKKTKIDATTKTTA